MASPDGPGQPTVALLCQLSRADGLNGPQTWSTVDRHDRRGWTGKHCRTAVFDRRREFGLEFGRCAVSPTRTARRSSRPARNGGLNLIDDLWRRSDVPVASLVQLAEADAMHESLRLARREALWALKALRDEPLELFAAVSQREARSVEEIREPAVTLRPMTSGGEVVEHYRHVGLTLRQHPASFLRADLANRRIVTCNEAMNASDGKWLTTAGLVLVRHRSRDPPRASCSSPSRTRPASPTW